MDWTGRDISRMHNTEMEYAKWMDSWDGNNDTHGWMMGTGANGLLVDTNIRLSDRSAASAGFSCNKSKKSTFNSFERIHVLRVL